MINIDLDNPFSVTKASEFSDEEINSYWVNFSPGGNASLQSILNPSEFMPKYIIGAKGCGKTHILKYLSFELQQIRYENNIERLFNEDKYIGLYTILGGLDSSRFSEKNVSVAEWKTIFEYYFELYVSDNLIKTIKKIIEELRISASVEKEIVQNILEIFENTDDVSSISSINSLLLYLSHLRKIINSQIRQAAFTRSLDYDEIRILFSPGDLIFGIPKVCINHISEMANVKFIYILDEYERLFEWQKIFVNTLVWDKKMPVTFWIGARTYGYTTRATQTNEIMKTGSEFDEVNLDDLIRSNEKLYKEFAENVFSKRIVKFYERQGTTIDSERARIFFREKFERYDESKIIQSIRDKFATREYVHLVNFRRKLRDAHGYSDSTLTEDAKQEINSLVKDICDDTDANPLEQKYKLFRFYYLWEKHKSGRALSLILEQVNEEFSAYKKRLSSKFDEIVDKRKKDLIAQLAKESQVPNLEYSGIDDFIHLSWGNPRNFIIILKKVIEFSSIRGEKPLTESGRITLSSQYHAVQSAAEWFYKDAEPLGEKGQKMYASLKRLTDYFIVERFSDKPVETTASCFYVHGDELSRESLECIDLMKVHSIIVEDSRGRIDKNSPRVARLFQINRILAPYWNLPTVVRGSVGLDRETAEAVFNFQFRDKFKEIYKDRQSKLNAPQFLKSPPNDLQIDLFK